MPRLSAWYVRASLIYLALGFTLGGLMLANEGRPLDPALGSYLPVHIEFLMVGWLGGLALGVAYWILPRFVSGLPRGDPRLAWLSFWLVNAGIWLVVAATLFLLPELTLPGRLLEAAGVATFVAGSWRRVRPSG